MTEIKDLIQNLQDITGRYGLKMLYLDSTDNILISRIGFSLEIFIETYINLKKEKINMAPVVAGERIYGVDNQGGFYHEHPYNKNYKLWLPDNLPHFNDFFSEKTLTT